MKVSLITRHAVANYGSLLQAYSTQLAIERLGCKCEVVDYVREDETPETQERTLLAGKSQWNSNPVLRGAYLALREPEAKRAGEAFAEQRERMLHMSKRYSTLDELRADPPVADVYVTGSDQVWGPVGYRSYDMAYALAYVPEGSRRVAYAASFGKSGMPATAEKAFRAEFGKYERICVREDSAAKLLAGWGIEAEQVLDPTLLLDGDDWRGLAEDVSEGRYVLVYQIHNNSVVNDYAKAAAKRLGLPLLRLSGVLHQVLRGGRFRYLPSVLQFVSYIDKAELLVTDSFHGTAFAINLGTPFVEVLPENGTAGRNTSILRLTGLGGRVAHSIAELPLCDEPIDFAPVHRKMRIERERSLCLLRECVEGSPC